MSTNIYAEGQLIRVERLQDETLEEQCKRICELKGILELGPFNKTWEEGLVTTPPDKSGSFSVTLRDKPKPKAPSELF